MIRDPARLEALRRTALLDTPAEESFDRITRLTSRALRAQVTLLSLVDAERQFFMSSVGLQQPWASRRDHEPVDWGGTERHEVGEGGTELP